MLMSKSRQAGSATSFVIIAIILVAVTVGSIVFVVNRGEQVRKDQAASKLADEEAAQKAKDADDKARATANQPTSSETPSGPSTNTPQTNNQTLPTTGIEVDIVRILAIALLAGTTTSFVVSRRGVKRPL